MTRITDRHFWLTLAVGSLSLGLLTSVSVLSLFHIFSFIPLLIIFFRWLKSENYFPWSAKVMVVLILWALISNFYNFHVLSEPWESFGKIKYWFFAFIGVFGFNEWLERTNEKTINRIISLFFFTIILATLYGYIKHFHNYDLIKGIYAKPDDGRRIGGFTGVMRYGYGMSMILTLLCGVWLHRPYFQRFLNHKILFFIIIVSGLGLFFSFARGGLVGFMISLPFLLYFYKKSLAIYSSIAIGIIIATLIAISASGGSEKSRYLLSMKSGTNTKRLSQYTAALYAIRENPLFRIGMKQFSYQVKRYKEKYNIKHPNYESHTHNIFLEMAASSGIPALLVLILWIGTWAYEVWKIGGITRAIILPFIINFCVAGQFEYLFDANNSLLIFFVYALSLYPRIIHADSTV